MEVPAAGLARFEILVLEDEVIVLMMLEDLLEEFGCVVRTALSIENALTVLRTSAPDGALLDLNIQGRAPVEVVDALVSRSVPFLLVTGYGAGESDPPAIKAAPRLQKPFTGEALRRKMVEVFLSGDDRRLRA